MVDVGGTLLSGFFSPRARAAAIASRRSREMVKAAAKGQREVFAVRFGTGFTWEVRKFGGVVLASGAERYTSNEEAIAAGQLALSAL